MSMRDVPCIARRNAALDLQSKSGAGINSFAAGTAPGAPGFRFPPAGYDRCDDPAGGSVAMRAIRFVAALLLSVVSAAALESSITASSQLSADELWKKVGDLCATTAWNPRVESCSLSADGRQRAIRVYGSDATAVSELESLDNVGRSFSYKAGGLLPVKNHRVSVSVTGNNAGSTLTMMASYEADGATDADAQKAVEGSMHAALCLAGPLRCAPDPAAGEIVEFENTPLAGKPVMLRAYLRRPSGAGPFPAVVLLHGCAGFAEALDRNWAARLAEWGYATLTVSLAAD
jgi:hypothetical protein